MAMSLATLADIGVAPKINHGNINHMLVSQARLRRRLTL
jgi:hypothetical protein